MSGTNLVDGGTEGEVWKLYSPSGSDRHWAVYIQDHSYSPFLFSTEDDARQFIELVLECTKKE